MKRKSDSDYAAATIPNNLAPTWLRDVNRQSHYHANVKEYYKTISKIRDMATGYLKNCTASIYDVQEACQL